MTEKIFEKYFQIDNKRGVYNYGSGIGLYFVKRLVELHHGRIIVRNRDGKGALFSFIIPTNESAYDASEIYREESIDTGEVARQDVYEDMAFKNGEPGNESGAESENRARILVVENDTDVAYYLRTLLAAEYEVVNRYDAESALGALESMAPDLILSDVRMPGMSGYDLCRAVKSDSVYCHIPVVMLTAKAAMEDQIEGLNIGANAYIIKPFDPAYLLAVVNSQIRSRNLLQNRFVGSTDVREIISKSLTAADKAFIKSLYEIMERELSNPELNISLITESLRISRTKLYYKIKGLTGENPNAFFKKYKLNRAMELLGEGMHNVSEIADLTGFSTVSHFSTSFKKHFGCPPSLIIKNKTRRPKELT